MLMIAYNLNSQTRTSFVECDFITTFLYIFVEITSDLPPWCSWKSPSSLLLYTSPQYLPSLQIREFQINVRPEASISQLVALSSRQCWLYLNFCRVLYRLAIRLLCRQFTRFMTRYYDVIAREVLIIPSLTCITAGNSSGFYLKPARYIENFQQFKSIITQVGARQGVEGGY